MHLGFFDDEYSAAFAYNQAAIKYHGEFAKLNELPNGYEFKSRRIRKKTSRFIGVSRFKGTGGWRMEICHKGRYYSSYHRVEIDAAKAYDLTAKKYKGDKAKLNFPDEV